MILRYLSFLIAFACNILLIPHAAGQIRCSNPQRICGNTVTAAPEWTNNMGNIHCLPNANHAGLYFFEVGSSGDATVHASGSNNNISLSYALLGPYNSIQGMLSACNNINGTNQPLESCATTNARELDITFTGVAPGQWYLLVLQNSNGSSGNITLSQSAGNATFNCCQLDANVQQLRPVCATSGQGGYIQIQPINVTGTIEYSKDGGQTWQGGNEFNNLSAGTYDIVVRDQSLCVKRFSVTVPGDITNNFITPPFQDICEGQQPATFQGSQPMGGDGNYTYLWQRSETDAFNNFNPAPGVNNQQNYTPPIANRTYWYRRQVFSAGCPSNTTGVPVNITGAVTPADAGPDQNQCNPVQLNLQGNVPSSGTGTWTQVSGPAATINNPALFNTTVNNVSTPGVYVFRWTINSPGCGSTSDEVAITVGGTPTTANAGPDLSRCLSVTAGLAGNTPATGTGVWSQVSGPQASILSPSDPNTVVAGLTPGASHVFRWTITSGTCGTSTDDVTVQVFLSPIAANAGPDQAICGTTQSTLAGNAPLNGTGAWSQVSGPNTAVIASPAAATTSITGLTPGTYVFRWTISNGVCIPSEDDVTVVVSAEPSVSVPGPDQQLCQVTSTVMDATPPTAGTGTWSQLSGPNGAGFANINDPKTSVANLLPGLYVFQWTVTSAGCRSSSNRVTVLISNTPTTAAAGPDQVQYTSGTFVMSANQPAVGNGLWTVVSGQAVITNPTSPTTTVTIPANTTAVLKWTISSGACTPSEDEVTLEYVNQADMQVVKTDAGSVYQTGQQVKYQVVITNNGPSDMLAANFQDVLPAALENYSWTFVTVGNGVTVTPNAGTSSVISTIVKMPFAPGNRIVLNVTGTVRATSTGGTIVRNTATILSPSQIPDPVPGNNTSTVDSVIANNPPVAVADFYETLRDVAVNGNVKTNDRDPDNDPLTVETTAVEGPNNGAVTLRADGSFTYTPASGYVGTDVFVYRICDNHGGCDTAHVYIRVKPPYVDLQIQKTASLTSAVAGQSLQYTVTLRNGGPSTIRPADRITMNDDFPDGYTPSAVTPSAGTFDLSTMIWTGLTLAPGASATLTIQGTVNAGFTGTSITNVAVAIPPAGMTDSTEARDSVTTPVTRSADLSITKTDGTTTYVPGKQVNYIIVVENSGPSDATGAIVTDALPAGITSGSWTASGSGGAVAPVTSGSMPMQHPVNIPVGGRITYRVTLDVPAGFTGALTNTASVAAPAGVTDPVPGNNTASDTDNPDPVYGLTIVKNGPAAAVAGGEINYLLTVYNNGPTEAKQVTITDAVPPQIHNVTWTVVTTGAATATTTGGTGNGINFNGTLPVGDNNLIIVSVKGTINNDATGTLRNIGVVAVPGDTQVVSNIVATTLRKQTGISIVKSGPPSHRIEAGRDIRYLIAVVNAGPSDATGVVITDAVPATIGNTSWRIELKGSATLAAGAPASGTGNAIRTTVDIPAGAGNEVDLIVTGTVAASATGMLVNEAFATAPGEQPESDNDSTTIISKPTPSIVKSGPATADAGTSITYNLLVGNSGPSDLMNASISDVIPVSIENVTWTATASGGASIVSGATGSGNLLGMVVNIPAGAQHTIAVTITGTIRADAYGTIRNTATMAQGGNITTSNTVATIIQRKNVIDIRKQAPDSARAGEVIRFLVNVTNNGPSDAFGVIVKDTIPAGLLNPKFTITANGASKVNSGKVENGVGILNVDIPAGSANNVIITATATIAADFEGVIRNRAVTNVPDNPDVPSNQTNTVVVHEPVLTIVKAGPANVTAGGKISYVLVIRNNGLADARQVLIRDVVPATVTNVTWGAIAGGNTFITAGANGTGNTVTVTADIPAGNGNSVAVNITGETGPDASGTFTNNATATPAGKPGYTSNNVVTQVLNSPAVQIGKSAPRALSAGSPITWQVVVNNNGLSDARNVVITDVIPAEADNISWTATGRDGATVATGASGTGRNVQVTGAIPAGGNASIVVTVQGVVASGFSGVITNTATVTADNVPPTSADVNTTVYNLSRLDIRKSGPDTANAGERISYQVTVDNNGPSDATGFRIGDIVPAQLTNVSWIASARGAAQIISGATGSGQVLDITATIPYGTGNRIIITVTGTIDPTFEGDINNNATALVPGEQAILSNTVTTHVVNKPSLQLVKIGPAEVAAGRNIGYLIYITNNGPSTAKSVELDDLVPKEVLNVTWKALAFGNAVIQGNAQGAGNNIVLDCTLPAGKGNFVTLEVEGVVDPSFVGNMLNISTALPNNQTQRNLADSVLTKVVNVASLEVLKTAPDTLAAGEQITYAINVTNSGPSNSNETIIRDTVPAGIGNITWRATIAGNATLTGVTSGSGNIIEVRGNIPAGNPHRILVTVSGTIDPAFTGASLLNIAHVDHLDSSFRDSATTWLVSRPNISISKTGPAVMKAGDQLQYQLRVLNNGPSEAFNLRITDTIPAGMLNPVWTVAVNGTGTTANATQGTGNVDVTANLPASSGHYIDITVTGTLDPAFTGDSIRNTGYARIAGIASDSSVVTTFVRRSSDLRILKTGPTIAVAGNRIDYRIVVKNFGPSLAQGVIIRDTVPAEILNTNWTAKTSGGATVSSTAGTGNLIILTGDIPADTGEIVIQIHGTIDPAENVQVLRNTAYALPQPGTTDPSEAVSTVTTTLSKEADLVIVKSGPSKTISGDSVIYTLVVTNRGLADVSGALIKDGIPSQVHNASVTAFATGGASFTIQPQTDDTVRVSANIPAGSQHRVVVRIAGITDPAAQDGTFVNTATVTPPADVVETIPQNNISSIQTAIHNDVGVIISKTGPSSADVKDSIFYTINVINTGFSQASGVTISDVVPAGISGVTWRAEARGGGANAVSPAAGTGGNISLSATLEGTGGSQGRIIVYVSGVVENNAPDTLRNTATVVSGSETRTATAVTVVNNTADLAIVKAGPALIAAGEIIHYEITVTNNGPADVTGASITDTIPAEISAVQWTAVAEGGATISSGSGTGNNIGLTTDIPVGTGKVTIQVSGRVDQQFTGILVNTAKVEPPAGVTDPRPTYSSVRTTVNRAQGLSVLKSGVSSINAGRSLAYILVIRNAGPSAANNVMITDSVPLPLSSVRWNASGINGAVIAAGGTGTGNKVNITANLPAGSSVTVAINGNTDPAFSGTIYNYALAGNNDQRVSSDTIPTTIINAPALAIRKTGPALAIAGGNVSYTVVVVNNGPSVATGVRIQDPVPAGLVNVRWTATAAGAATIADNGIEHTGHVAVTGTLPPGDTNRMLIQITGQVDPSATANIINVANAQAGSLSVSDSVTTALRQLVALRITKTAPDTVFAGSDISYGITLNNDGPSLASNTIFTDTIPATLGSVTWTATAAGNATITGGNITNGTGNIIRFSANIPAGDTNRVVIRVTGSTDAAFSGAIMNTAYAMADGGFSNQSNMVTTQVVKAYDIRLLKTGPDTASAGTQVQYQINVMNNGPSSATGVAIADVLPVTLQQPVWSAVASGSAAIQGGDISNAAGNVNFVADLPAGAANFISVTVTGNVPPDFTGRLTNTATYTIPDSAVVNGNTVVTDVVSIANVRIQKSGPDTATAGSRINYVLQVNNGGPSDSGPVVITDTLAAGLSDIRWSATTSGTATITGTASGSGSPVIINGNIPAGGGNTILVNVSGIVPAAETGVRVNAAHVLKGDSLLSSDSVRTVIKEMADLDIVKSGPDTVLAGTSVHYVITVENNGPSDAPLVTISDLVPPELSSVEWHVTYNGGARSAGASSDSSSNTILLPVSIPAGAGNRVRIDVTGITSPAFTGIIRNTAQVLENGVVKDGDSVRTTVVTDVKLFIGKVGPATAAAGNRIAYRVVAANAGASDLTSFSITDAVPATLTNVSWTATVIGNGVIATGATGSGNTVIVTGSLNGGTSNAIVIDISGTIPAGAGGTIVNSASIVSGANAATSNIVETIITPQYALSLDKSAPATATPGEVMAYVLRIRNGGPSDATGVQIRDTVPALLQNVAWTATAANGATVTPASGTGSIVALTAGIPAATGSEVVITIRGTVGSGFAGTIGNTGYAVGNGVTFPSNETQTEIGSTADLSVEKSGRDNVPDGGRITWTLQLSNNGPLAADGAVVTDTLPAQVSNASAAAIFPTGGTANVQVTVTNNIVRAVIGTFPAGGKVNIAIAGDALGVGNITNVAWIQPPAGVTDPVPGNNRSADVVTAITAPVKLSIRKTVLTPGPYPVGAVVRYRLEVDQPGLFPLNPVWVTDQLPALLGAPVLGTPTAGRATYVAGEKRISWTIGSLAPGITHTLEYEAPLLDTGRATNTAIVYMPGNGVKPAIADTATAVILGGLTADLQVTKQLLTPPPYQVQDKVTYLITLTNNGPDNATGITLTDVLSNNLGNLEAMEAGAGTAAVVQNRITWNVPALANGASATLRFTVRINNGGVLVNEASAKGNERDPNLVNNTARTQEVPVTGDEIFIPNTITPNGDGRNDKFVIPGLQRFPGSALMVYNRWGNLVFQSKDYHNQWDGNGLNEGTYFYILQLKTPQGMREYKGWIELLR